MGRQESNFGMTGDVFGERHGDVKMKSLHVRGVARRDTKTLGILFVTKKTYICEFNFDITCRYRIKDSKKSYF